MRARQEPACRRQGIVHGARVLPLLGVSAQERNQLIAPRLEANFTGHVLTVLFLAVIIVCVWPVISGLRCPVWVRSLIVLAGLIGVSALGWWVWPSSGPQVAAFDSAHVDIGNMPERKSVTNTWNGKPWDEDFYSDVRLNLQNGPNYRIENIDLAITVPGNSKDPKRILIAAIDQLTKVPGVEFPKPNPAEATFDIGGFKMPVSLQTSAPPNAWPNLPQQSLKAFIPKLLGGQKLELIIGVKQANQPSLPAIEKPIPKYLHVTGTYQVIGKESIPRTLVDELVEVK